MSIVAQKITYIHPDNQVLFKGIDLTINKGQKVALVGNNGSGKSTFLRILAGTLQAQEGEIIYPTPPYYVPQHFGQYDNLTVAQALRIDGKLEALRAITEGDASLSNFNTLADDWTIEERSLAALHAWGFGAYPPLPTDAHIKWRRENQGFPLRNRDPPTLDPTIG